MGVEKIGDKSGERRNNLSRLKNDSMKNTKCELENIIINTSAKQSKDMIHVHTCFREEDVSFHFNLVC